MKNAVRILCLLVGLALVPAVASAQLSIYKPSRPAIGERYNFEFSLGMWNPTPSITFSSDQLSIIGTRIDAVKDLGIAQQKFREYRFTLRPAKKHKVLFEYVPIRYAPESVLTRTIVFRGVPYDVGLPVNSSLEWKTYRFGYEYDLIYRDRFFLGVIGDVKYTDVHASIESPLAKEATSARAPIPGIGGIARAYVAKNVSVTGELTGFKLPDSATSDYSGRDVDFDVYGTVNVNDNVGAQVGYRSMDVAYRVRGDSGTFTLKGMYLRGVVRF